MSDWQPSLSIHWYDRNAITHLRSYSAAQVAPHAVAVRWTYLVPSGKKAFIEFMDAKIERDTAAGTGNVAVCGIQYTKKGEAVKTLIIAFLYRNSNAAGDKDRIDTGQSMVMNAGDKIESYTRDVSIGGLVNYNVGCKIMEFDADPPKSFLYIPDPIPEDDLQQPEAVKDPPM